MKRQQNSPWLELIFSDLTLETLGVIKSGNRKLWMYFKKPYRSYVSPLLLLTSSYPITKEQCKTYLQLRCRNKVKYENSKKKGRSPGTLYRGRERSISPRRTPSPEFDHGSESSFGFSSNSNLNQLCENSCYSDLSFDPHDMVLALVSMLITGRCTSTSADVFAEYFRRVLWI